MERDKNGKFSSSDEITPKQQELIMQLIYEKKNRAEACRIVGVPRTTLYYWLKTDIFKIALAKERMNMFVELSAKAMSRLEELMDSADSRTALKAVEDVLRENSHLKDKIDFSGGKSVITVSLAETDED